MCIICNCDNNDELKGLGPGGEFLHAYSTASNDMAKAAALMLRCAQVATTTEARKRYNATHKKMTRLLRDWNRIEHEREVADKHPAEPA